MDGFPTKHDHSCGSFGTIILSHSHIFGGSGGGGVIPRGCSFVRNHPQNPLQPSTTIRKEEHLAVPLVIAANVMDFGAMERPAPG